MDLKTFYIVDGNHLIHRAYHSPTGIDLASSKGVPTKAIYVFFKSLFSMMERRRPDYIAITFDENRETTFRRKLSPVYKNHRSSHGDDFRIQVDWIHRIVQAMGFCQFHHPEYEADDIIASLAVTGENEGRQPVLVSRDRDLYQCLTDITIMYDPMEDKYIDKPAAERHWGLPINLITLAKAIMGDTGDNIIGARGIGEKTAAKYALRYETAENLLRCAASLPARHREALAEINLLLNLQLTTVRKDLKFPFSWSLLEAGRVSTKGAANLFHELDFQQWSKL